MDAEKMAEAKRHMEMAVNLFASSANDDGSFKTFDQIELHANSIGDQFSALLTQKSIDDSLGDRTKSCTCPKCDQPGKRRDEPDPRVIQTGRGEVQWNEDEYFCRKCRKSFFPSNGSIGTESGVQRQSAG